MPRISNMERMRQKRQQTLVIRTMTSIGKLNQTMRESFQYITDYLEELDEVKSGVGFVVYYNFDFEKMDIAVGFPVANLIKGRGKIKAEEIPEQDMLFCMYQGPYNKIGSTYEEMDQWIDEHGYRREEMVYEYYYNGSEVEENQLLTRILMPLRKNEA